MITVAKEERLTRDTFAQPSRKHGVLVVASDLRMRDVLNLWLIDQGYGVWTAATGLEAIEIYTHHRDVISVVLLDVNMAEMDGPRTLVALRELNPQVCCCFMGDCVNGYTEMGLLDMGAEAVLRKPFRLAELGKVLWKLAAPIQRQTAMQDDLWRDDGGQG